MEVSGLVRKQRHKNLCQMEIYFNFHLHIRSDVLLVLARAFKCPEPPTWPQLLVAAKALTETEK